MKDFFTILILLFAGLLMGSRFMDDIKKYKKTKGAKKYNLLGDLLICGIAAFCFFGLIALGIIKFIVTR